MESIDKNSLTYEVARIFRNNFVRGRENPVSGWSKVRKFVKTYVSDVYNSVYGFINFPDHPYVDRVVIDIDNPNKIYDAVDRLKQYRMMLVFSGRGFHIYLCTEPITRDQDAYLRGANTHLRKVLDGIIDDAVYINPRQMIRSIGSKNSRTGLYCISLDKLDDLDTIRLKALNPSPELHILDGDPYPWPLPSYKPKVASLDVGPVEISETETDKTTLDVLASQMRKPACYFTTIAFGAREGFLQGMSDYTLRFFALLFLRDCLLLSLDESVTQCAHLFHPRQIDKINKKKQLRRVYSAIGYNFNCDYMKNIGVCPVDCQCNYYKEQARLIMKIAAGEIDEDAADKYLRQLAR